MLKGLDEKGISKLQKRGYRIDPLPGITGQMSQYFHVLENGRTIVEISFDSTKDKNGKTDYDKMSGTISVLTVQNGYRWFKKLIGIYVTDEGIVFDYEDKDGKPKTVRENGETWIL